MSKDNLIQLFKISRSFKLTFVELIETIFQGLWLGFLSHEHLNKITDLTYTDSNIFKNYAYTQYGLLDWEARIFDEFFYDCNSILICAAGSGRETIALSRRNIKVDAFDCNQDMVRECRRMVESQGIITNVLLSNPDCVPEELGIYDGIIVGWNCYSHIIGRKSRIDFLKQLNTHIKENRPVLISFYSIDEKTRSHYWIFKIANIIQSIRNRNKRTEIGDSIGLHVSHIFTKDEIESELRDANFKLAYYSEISFPHVVGIALK